MCTQQAPNHVCVYIRTYIRVVVYMCVCVCVCVCVYMYTTLYYEITSNKVNNLICIQHDTHALAYNPHMYSTCTYTAVFLHLVSCVHVHEGTWT